jgi:diguanylate cyclase (GGDEF)-like protein
VKIERRASTARDRSGELRRLQHRFTVRWVSGITIGLLLVAGGLLSQHVALATASRATKGSPAVTRAIARLAVAADISSAGAVAVLIILAAFMFRPLDRTLRREGMWMEQVEHEQALETLRRRFGSELHEALEMAVDETAIGGVVARVFATAVPTNPAELLLADSSESHLTLAVAHPASGRAGCGVGAPFECPAVRRGTAQSFPTSTAINACPHLADRGGAPRSALCVPVAFMGRALGVVHVTGPDGEPAGPEEVHRMDVLAIQVGTALGTYRAFSRAQLQASTDSLTGLLNRRSAEDQLIRRLAGGEQFALVMADLDHFKLLNDTYGHQVGDRALRLFADTVRRSLRTEDIFARWGGEEFVIALPSSDRVAASATLDRTRLMLVEACARAETPSVTASFGVADTTMSADLDELLQLADEALLAAKARGRDRIEHAGPPVENKIGTDLEAAIRQS